RVGACSSPIRPPAPPPLFPYTTLFRSPYGALGVISSRFSLLLSAHDHQKPSEAATIHASAVIHPTARIGQFVEIGAGAVIEEDRSEEHTSELQSRENLVCRLLLEKKKR